MSKPANIRLKLFKALDRQPHRYLWLRRAAQTFSMLVLVGVPLSGLTRVDFWAGEHRLLFQPAPFKHALAGVIIGIAAMYGVTFLSNLLAGRLFCGWGCPVGQVSRFGERLDAAGLTRKQRWIATFNGAAYSAVFVVSVFAWWCDPRMLVLGSLREVIIGWSITAVGTVGAFLHGRYWQWEFCKKVCPIGMYYSVVAPAKYFGIHFRNAADSCIDCKACDNVCPVSLTPRDLMALTDSSDGKRGLSITDAPGRNHCLECGDCVRACEFMIATKGDGPVPLLMGYYDGPQRIDAPGDEPPPQNVSEASTTREESPHCEVARGEPVEACAR